MISVTNVPLPLDAGLPNEKQAQIKAFARALGCKPSDIAEIVITKRSIDARKKQNVHFVASAHVTLCTAELEQQLLLHPPKGIGVNAPKPYEPLSIPNLEPPDVSPVVVGTGPAGLFAALYLARCGLRPLVIEQGAPVDERTRDIEQFIATGELNPYSNIQFGEGGAGTYSDGKLTTNIKNPYCPHVLHWFVEFGAPEEILWQAHPHIGSDHLRSVVRAMRESIEALGGQVLFHTKLCDMVFENGQLSAIELEQVETAERYRQPCKQLILACGHSAREVYELYRQKNLVLERKPFSVGVRIEHPQSLINEAQWGSAAHHRALGAAEYKMAVHLPNHRSVYTFCMCPGGEVVAAASEQGGIVTNGMSNFARAGKNANAALLVNVEPEDFGDDEDVLAGIAFQRAIEQAAYDLSLQQGGKPYQAPAESVGSFLKSQNTAARSQDQHFDESFDSSYSRGVVSAPIANCLPRFVSESLALGLPLLDKKLHGFAHPQALLIAPETRSSAPVRMVRNGEFEAYFATELPGDSELTHNCVATGIYPCGEGAGYAGGIMSAAVDGLRVAEALAHALQ